MTRCVLVAQVLVVAVVLLDYHLHFAMTLRFLVLTVCCPRSLLLTSGLARAHLYSQLFRALQVLGQKVNFSALRKLRRMENLHPTAVLACGNLLWGDSGIRRVTMTSWNCNLRWDHDELIAHAKLSLLLVHVYGGLLR